MIENLALPGDGNWSAASSTISLSRRSHDLPSTPVSTRAAIIEDNTTPKRAPRIIEEVDLTTPKRDNIIVEEIDLVTPNSRTKQFIDNERKYHENGSGDHEKPINEFPVLAQWKSKSRGIPAGAESYDEDSDELEIG